MAAVPDRPGYPRQRVILHGVRWETYERLLEDLADCSAPRLTFDGKTLEIMSPTPEHEEYNRTLALLVEVAAEEMGIDLRRLGSTTFKRQDLLKGFEPDSCFYIQSVARVSSKKGFDLARDPPPDLIIEIDITSPSLDRFPIFAQTGVPEVWRYDGKRVQVFLMADGTDQYREAEHSAALPLLSSAIINQFLEESASVKSTAWLRRVRQWIRAQMGAVP